MISFVQPGAGPFNATIRRQVQVHWRLFLTEGIILSLLGIGAVVVPPIASFAMTVFLGWLLLVAGFVGLAVTLAARRAPGFGWSVLSALVAVFAGGGLLLNPLQGVVTLTFVMIAFFIIDGILTIVLAQSHRRELSGKAGWLTANGVVDLVLAGIIIVGLPGTLAWTLGLLVGIDLIFGGISLIAMALDARENGEAGTA